MALIRGSGRRGSSVGIPALAVLLALLSTPFAAAQVRPPFAPGKASFAVRFRDEVSTYAVLAVFVSSRESMALEVSPERGGQRFELAWRAGECRRTGPFSWEWRAPAAHGLYPLLVTETTSGEIMTLNAFVMVPFFALRGEHLNGYRIGKYPTVPLRGLSIYERPVGFVEVTEALVATAVSPHFRLGQFVCKQEGGFPKYVILRERLLVKLEVLLEEVNSRGYRCDTFHVMSGYRTPYYNRLIRNVAYSRHLWGGAADIFIDEDGDAEMDDLNRDGAINRRDAKILYDIAESLTVHAWYERFIGGLGLYEATRERGPFVHVDTRGFRARWGK